MNKEDCIFVLLITAMLVEIIYCRWLTKVVDNLEHENALLKRGRYAGRHKIELIVPENIDFGLFADKVLGAVKQFYEESGESNG